VAKLLRLAAVMFVVAGFSATPAAGATILAFDCLTNNNATNCATGEAQFTVELIDPGSAGIVDFKFLNIGSNASSITDVYFDDGTLLGISDVVGGVGTDFSAGASPTNLAGGNLATPAFVATAGFSADSNDPSVANGVGLGEFVTIRFDLLPGKTFADSWPRWTDQRYESGSQRISALLVPTRSSMSR
jgi:hypothetical protein